MFEAIRSPSCNSFSCFAEMSSTNGEFVTSVTGFKVPTSQVTAFPSSVAFVPIGASNWIF